MSSAVLNQHTPLPRFKEQLHVRLDELMGGLHALTKRRDAGKTTLLQSMPQELALVVELGQVQDRLRVLGCHDYDGCPECRPLSSERK